MSTLDWQPGFNANFLAAELERRRSPDSMGRGNTAFPGLAFHDSIETEDLFHLVRAALGFPAELPENEVEALVERAVFRAAQQGRVTSGTLLRYARTALARHMGQQHREYHVLGTLTAATTSRLGNRRSNGVLIFFYGQCPALYDRSLADSLIREHHVRVPQDQLTTIVSCTARTPKSAVERAVRELHLFRAWWNLPANHGKTTLTRSSHPLNEIRLGPLTTVHLPDGALAERCIWRSDDFLPQGALPTLTDSRDSLRYARRIRSRIRACTERRVLEDFFIAYVRALDELDHERCFIGLWNVLEQATGGLTQNYERNLRRALVCGGRMRSGHRVLLGQTLRLLRSHRNGIVHNSNESALTHFYMQRVKFFVEAVLAFLVDFLPYLKRLECVHAVWDTLASTSIEKDSEIRQWLGLGRKT